MKFGKLVDNNLIFAPNYIEVGDAHVWNAPPDQMLELGWKQISFTEVPDDEQIPTGYKYDFEWEETETEIVQTWILVKLPDDIDEYEAYQIIIGGLEE